MDPRGRSDSFALERSKIYRGESAKVGREFRWQKQHVRRPGSQTGGGAEEAVRKLVCLESKMNPGGGAGRW